MPIAYQIRDHNEIRLVFGSTRWHDQDLPKKLKNGITFKFKKCNNYKSCTVINSKIVILVYFQILICNGIYFRKKYIKKKK